MVWGKELDRVGSALLLPSLDCDLEAFCDCCAWEELPLLDCEGEGNEGDEDAADGLELEDGIDEEELELWLDGDGIDGELWELWLDEDGIEGILGDDALWLADWQPISPALRPLSNRILGSVMDNFFIVVS